MRALCVSNLIAQDQKRYIGALSAYCGVVCAAAGAGAAITYLCGGDEEQIENTVINTIANIGGMVCDGAKPSCAAKIATSLQAAILSHKMAMRGWCLAVERDLSWTVRKIRSRQSDMLEERE